MLYLIKINIFNIIIIFNYIFMISDLNTNSTTKLYIDNFFNSNNGLILKTLIKNNILILEERF